MKAILVILALLGVLSGLVSAQAPTLTVRDVRGQVMPLRLEEVEIHVDFLDDVAETTITLGFRNDTNRLLEGEFIMPLPEGATVSTYALEVNGAMREAVAVEKERARFAYESIKRRMVDPGIVERQEGNVYRTRIFPIPRNGVKRVRIGYVEHLARVGGELRYQLPFRHQGKVAHFSCGLAHLRGETLRVLGGGGVDFAADGSGILRMEAEDVEVFGKIEVAVVAKPGAAVSYDEDGSGDRYFYLTDTFPDGIAERQRPVPASVRLVWDVSESGRQRDHNKEFALLEAWFKRLDRTRVTLCFLRNSLSEGGEFEIRNGDWSALRKVLEEIYYDGATRLDRLGLEDFEEDLALVFTDGVAPFSSIPKMDQVTFVIDAAPSAASPGVSAASRKNGGAYIDLSQLDLDAALRLLSTRRPGVVSVEGVEEDDYIIDTSGEPGAPVRIVGRLHQRGNGLVMVNYGVGRREEQQRRVRYDPEEVRTTKGIVRRLWAQRALGHFEAAPSPDEVAIIAHCKKHRLVSDFTSLIVLERFSDHLRYEIPPPEPELLARYMEAMEKKKTSDDVGWSRLVSRWKDKREWHQREFPWVDVVLLPRFRQVSIWVKSVQAVFEEDELDAKAFGVINSWRRSVLAIMERKRDLKNAADYEAWRVEVGRLVEQGSKLRRTPLALDSDQPLVVSVRGLVNTPGKVTGTDGMTLTEAIEEAGGVHLFGSNSGVDLYRNAGKTTYNVLSRDYSDVVLRPGDMIVVKENGWDYDDWEGVDPFSSEGDVPPPDPREQPAVVEQSDIWVGDAATGGSADGDPFGGIGGQGGGPPPEAMSGEVRVVAGAAATPPALTGLQKVLEEGGDAEAAYRSLRKETVYPIRFYIEVARLFFTHGHEALGEQVLSNLIETPQLRLDRLLSAAMWLREFGQEQAAAELLQHGVSMAPGVLVLRYQLAHAAVAERGPGKIAMELMAMVQAGLEEDPTAASIALTDFFGLEASAREEVRAALPAELVGNLDADLRVVITTNHPESDLDLEVAEPSGHTCRYESPCGGRKETAGGISEYMMRRALPGRYVVTCRARVPLTVHATLYKNWGRPNQEAKELTVLLEGGSERVTLAEYDFEFAE